MSEEIILYFIIYSISKEFEFRILFHSKILPNHRNYIDQLYLYYVIKILTNQIFIK